MNKQSLPISAVTAAAFAVMAFGEAFAPWTSKPSFAWNVVLLTATASIIIELVNAKRAARPINVVKLDVAYLWVMSGWFAESVCMLISTVLTNGWLTPGWSAFGYFVEAVIAAVLLVSDVRYTNDVDVNAAGAYLRSLTAGAGCTLLVILVDTVNPTLAAVLIVAALMLSIRGGKPCSIVLFYIGVILMIALLAIMLTVIINNHGVDHSLTGAGLTALILAIMYWSTASTVSNS